MDVPEKVMCRLRELFCADPSIEKVYLFGSRARGDHRFNSDIDLLIQGVTIKPSTLVKLNQAAGLYKVDAVTLTEQMEETFYEEIQKDLILIYDREYSAAVANADSTRSNEVYNFTG